MSDFNKTIGMRVHILRNQNNLTREALAEAAEITPQFLVHIENGTRGMSAKTLFNLSRALHVSPDFLLTGKDMGDKTRIAAEALGSLPDDERILTEAVLRAAIDIVTKTKQE